MKPTLVATGLFVVALASTAFAVANPVPPQAPCEDLSLDVCLNYEECMEVHRCKLITCTSITHS